MGHSHSTYQHLRLPEGRKEGSLCAEQSLVGWDEMAPVGSYESLSPSEGKAAPLWGGTEVHNKTDKGSCPCGADPLVRETDNAQK